MERIVESCASSRDRIFFGPAGWSYADWKGVVYPPGVTDGLASRWIRFRYRG